MLDTGESPDAPAPREMIDLEVTSFLFFNVTAVQAKLFHFHVASLFYFSLAVESKLQHLVAFSHTSYQRVNVAIEYVAMTIVVLARMITSMTIVCCILTRQLLRNWRTK